MATLIKTSQKKAQTPASPDISPDWNYVLPGIIAGGLIAIIVALPSAFFLEGWVLFIIPLVIVVTLVISTSIEQNSRGRIGFLIGLLWILPGYAVFAVLKAGRGADGRPTPTAILCAAVMGIVVIFGMNALLGALQTLQQAINVRY